MVKVLEMKIDLVPGVIPYKFRVRPLNPDQKENLRDQTDEWLEQGVIEPSISPWGSPLVPMRKKDGRTRWVTDLRELNFQWRTLGTFQTFSPGGMSTHGHGDQDTTVQD